ncbi:hypothetical protein NDU88_002572 [Pleurodeles waltl]|uniref:Uncharacterized protein n=1 Tax=Pleurodeles waltl TaxID=8319 RepID=A0AAV7KV48_PLEWA|nr:hypothetical protein NDU88_002572 [Pleurodeles waltl]
MEVRRGSEISKVNQKEIQGLCENLGKQFTDLASRTAILEEMVGDLNVAEEANTEEIQQLKFMKSGA